MIVRITRGNTLKNKAEEMEKVLTTLLPTFKRTKGCLGVILAKDFEKDPPEIVAITVWKDMEAVKNWNPKWSGEKIYPEEAPLLSGKSTTEHYEVIDRFSR